MGVAPIFKMPRWGSPADNARISSALESGTLEDVLRAELTGPDGVPPKPNSVTKAVNRAKDRLRPVPQP